MKLVQAAYNYLKESDGVGIPHIFVFGNRHGAIFADGLVLRFLISAGAMFSHAEKDFQNDMKK